MNEKTCKIDDCYGKHYGKGYCCKHYQRWRRHGEPEIDKRSTPEDHPGWLSSWGYVRMPKPRVLATGYMYEHQAVMVEKLGRHLYPGETVHHKNGVKHDNRPENLELWVTNQPAGQRPEDLVAWAHQILERYGDLEN